MEEGFVAILDRCPRCGGPLESGYLYGPKGVVFDREKPGYWSGAIGDDYDWIIRPLARDNFRRADRCPSCHLVTFEGGVRA